MKAKQILAGLVAALSISAAAIPPSFGQQAPGRPAPSVPPSLLSPAPSVPPSSLSPAPPKTPATQLFDKWMYSCEERACQVFLTLADDATKEAKVSWSFVYDPKSGKLSTIVQLPLMVALPPGVRIRVDDKTQYTWPFQFCDGTGCRAVAVLTEEIFASLKGRQNIVVQFVPYGSRQATNYQIPMAGLAAATEKLIADAKASRK